MSGELKRRVYQVLEAGRPDDRLSRGVDTILIILILANVAAAIAATVETFYQHYRTAFWAFEVISVMIFTLEYLCRLWVSTEHHASRRRNPVRARLLFVVSPYGLIDLVAILPFYLSFFVPAMDLRVLRLFRLIRLLKLVRYSPALATLWRVLVEERRALAATLLIMISLLTLSSTAMYYAERHVQPESFGSIPNAMWWGLATLTTVGYGDVVPVTALGRIIGAFVMVFGLGMFALPIGIIASGFASEIHRRDFVVTWGMVARVPLFARLDALSVSRITNLLRARLVEPNTAIFHQGDSPDFMYFIASGEVEVVDVGTEPIRLKEGEFFGETALLYDIPRKATIRTVTRCRLLVLDRNDFKELIESDGDLREAISKVAERRLSEYEKTTGAG